MGDYLEISKIAEPARPLLYVTKLGKIDARRLVYEIFYPEAGLENYKLYRSPFCHNDLCVNPKHFTKKLSPINPYHDYPVYLNHHSPFSAHLIGSYHPHATPVAQPPLPLSESPKKGQQIKIEQIQPLQEVPPPTVPVPIEPSTNPDEGLGFGNAFGKIYDSCQFAEGELEPCNVKDEWQAFTSQFVANSELVIRNWISKWGSEVPSGATINNYSVECVGDAFKELKNQNKDSETFKLSEILAMEKYWFHPRLVIGWYSTLSIETKEKISINQ